MGLRTGINRIAVVLKWGAIAWLFLGVFAFVLGLTSKPASELFLLDGLLFGVPGVIGLVLAYIVSGFSKPEKSERQQLRPPGSAPQANDGVNESMLSGSEAAVPPPAPPNTSRDPLAHQALATRWPRFFARMFDVWWEVGLVAIALGFVLGFYLDGIFLSWLNGPGARTFFSIACLPVALVLDAAIYRVAGNTPGKSLLGLKVGTLDGKPLSFSQYLSRNFWVWASGLGLGIPLVNIFTMVIESRRLDRGQQASYDEPTGFRVRAKPSSLVRKTAFGLAFSGLLVAMSALSSRGLEQPAQRSSIEAELLSAAKDVARTAPKMIDADTRLDGATAGPGLTFTYLYSLPNIESSQVQPGAFDTHLAPKVKEAACASNKLKPFFDNHVEVQYEYRGKDGSRIGTIVLDRETCGVH
jgi:uncharacterized RDD family membrane protein YckC